LYPDFQLVERHFAFVSGENKYHRALFDKIFMKLADCFHIEQIDIVVFLNAKDTKIIAKIAKRFAYLYLPLRLNFLSYYNGKKEKRLSAADYLFRHFACDR
jgi:hypothetical protein